MLLAHTAWNSTRHLQHVANAICIASQLHFALSVVCFLLFVRLWLLVLPVLLPFVVYLFLHTAAFEADPVFVDPLPVLPVAVA